MSIPAHYFHRSHEDSTILVRDNLDDRATDGKGQELFIEIVEDENVEVTSYGLLNSPDDVRDAGAVLTREQAESLRDYINAWLARTAPPRRDYCDVCKDDPAGHRWLCPNRANHEFVTGRL